MVNQSEGSIGATLSTYPMTIILTLVGFFFAIFVIGMLGLHTYFLIKNITTSEYLKDYYGLTSGNPFQKYIISITKVFFLEASHKYLLEIPKISGKSSIISVQIGPIHIRPTTSSK